MVKGEKKKGRSASRQPSNNSSILQYFGKKKDEPKPTSKLFTTLGEPSRSKSVVTERPDKNTLKTNDDDDDDDDFQDITKSAKRKPSRVLQHQRKQLSVSTSKTTETHDDDGTFHKSARPGNQKFSVPETPDKKEVTDTKLDDSILSAGGATPLDDSCLLDGDTTLDDEIIPCTPDEKRPLNKERPGIYHISGNAKGSRNPFRMTGLKRQNQDNPSQGVSNEVPLTWNRSVKFPKKYKQPVSAGKGVAAPRLFRDGKKPVSSSTLKKQVSPFKNKWSFTGNLGGGKEHDGDMQAALAGEDEESSKSEKENLETSDQDGGCSSASVAMDTSDVTMDDLDVLEGYLTENVPLKSATNEVKWKSVKLKKTPPGSKRNVGQHKHRFVSWTGAVLGKRSPLKGISPCKKKQAVELQCCSKESQESTPRRQSARSLLKDMDVTDSLEEGKESFTEACISTATTADTSQSLDSASLDHHDGTMVPLDTIDENKMEQSEISSQLSSESSVSELWGSLNESMLAALDMDGLEGTANTPVKHKGNVSCLDTSGYTLTQSQRPSFLRNRYKVIQSEYKPGQLTLTVSLSYDANTEKTVVLKGIWASTLVDIGSTICVHGEFDTSGTCIIDQEKNYVLVEPDLLLTGTNIASSIRCQRRSVLSEIFKGSDFSSKAMACGTLLHEVFQQAIVTRTFSKQALSNIVMTTIAKQPHLNNMYVLGIQESEMLDMVEAYLSPMEEWAKVYLQPTPTEKSKMDIKFPGENKSKTHKICVSDIRDIEDNMWSPQWGIKGKIDITAEVKIHRGGTVNNRADTFILPLELKTGKPTNSVEHRSQLILYSLMLSEIVKPDSGLGLLLYLKNGAMMSVPANHMDKRELLNLRNKLAYYLNKKVDEDQSEMFPEMIEDDFTCRHCPQLQKCALVYRTIEKEKMHVSDVIREILWGEVGHLEAIHLEYFMKWYTLCRLEMHAMKKGVFWKKSVQQRELSGQCMGDMMIYGPVNKTIDGQYICVFCRHGQQSCSQLISSQPINSVGIGVGDRLAISLQDLSRIALCFGIVTDIDDKTITIVTEKDLGIFYDRESTVYRLDKDEGFSVMTSSLNNLAQLLSSNQHSVNLSDLIIKLKRPDFSDGEISSIVPSQQLKSVQDILKTSNSDQKRAITNVLKCKTHSLIVGMPGTGKTTTIVNLVRVLIACKMSILLTSYTHSAVDNILLKLKNYGIDFLRVGAINKIHPELADYSDYSLSKECESVEELENLYKSKPIVASTCLGIKHVLFSRRRFDICIVDEASQIGQMVCVGPLLCADRFVLVGDHRQLPPLVQSHKAREMGMDESLFQRLTCHASATTDLCMQYRMNASIMEISNTLIYDGKLKCGNDQIANGLLVLPDYDAYKQSLGAGMLSQSWLVAAINPELPVCFLNTDKLPARHQEVYHSLVNETESNLVCLLAEALHKSGCDFSNIGVIAPYRQQCRLIASQVSSLRHQDQLEVNTVDKYQGRDKDVIIVSFVRSSEEEENVSKGFGILQDVRRLNVAVTRAKHKLIMIGSVTTLSQYTPLKKLLAYLQDSGLMFQIYLKAAIHHDDVYATPAGLFIE